MSLRQITLLLPCDSWDNFPTHLRGEPAAELWAASTATWHPALVAASESLPTWRPADEPPEPDSVDGTLFVVPSVSRERLPIDWQPQSGSKVQADATIVDATSDRMATASALLAAVGLSPGALDAEMIADFFALGYAYQQTMLLTKAMQYASVFELTKFTEAVVAAARAAVAGDNQSASDGIDRALDLLADARNHYYSVEFYLIDVTLVARSTLGEPLRARLASGQATTLLASAELLTRLAEHVPETQAKLKRAIADGTVCVAGGLSSTASTAGQLGPEALLRELTTARHVYQRLLGQEAEIYAQFASAFSPLLPEILSGLGFHGALHAAFDGSRIPLAEQCKVRWGRSHESSLDAVSAVPLDTAQPETWLSLAERISDSISRDHVATVLLAGWPGQEFAAYEDLRRVVRRSPLLGKLVTLDQYFELTSSVDVWTTFHPTQYRDTSEPTSDALESRLAAYRQEVADVHRQLLDGLAAVAPQPTASDDLAEGWLTTNPWNFDSPHYHGVDLLNSSQTAERPTNGDTGAAWFQAAVPGCGFDWHADEPTPAPSMPIADGRRLRNEHLEVVVSDETGGIQSLRAHGDRGTRVSQRLTTCDATQHKATLQRSSDVVDAELQPIGPRMLADVVEITRIDPVVGEITSRGRLIDAAGDVVARFTQSMRLPRALRAVLVDVTLDVERPSPGGGWCNALASRVMWRDEGAAFRRGANWVGRSTDGREIDSAEWVEIEDSAGKITIFPLGLPYHRRTDATKLDTLLAVADDVQVRRQFAVGLDVEYPTQLALALLTADAASAAKSPTRPPTSRGWYFHVGAKNVVLTHVEPLTAPRAGVRLRLLETEGRAVRTKLAAFRPLASAWQTDYRGGVIKTLRIEDGQLCLNLDPYQWLQLEVEW